MLTLRHLDCKCVIDLGLEHLDCKCVIDLGLDNFDCEYVIGLCLGHLDCKCVIDLRLDHLDCKYVIDLGHLDCKYVIDLDINLVFDLDLAGAFLIPYVIMMILIGMPLLFMEYAFGQYFGVGGLTIFKKVCPMLQGECAFQPFKDATFPAYTFFAEVLYQFFN